MPDHVVAEGESVFTLAWRAGLPWRTIWDDARNETLRARSGNPGTLAVGETCFVPERQQHAQTHARGTHQRFALRRPTTRLRLRLRRAGRPLAGLDFTLAVPGQGDVAGTTGEQGQLEADVLATATEGTLRVGGRQYTLRLQRLAPYDSDRGVQQRLRNLGHPPHGDPPDAAGPGTLAALNEWRARQGHAVFDQLSPEARVAVRDGHGC
ncbi:MAG: hypothetical protein KDK70_02665 [Myxococcales bacterium]|nr:hypothetical protein [Myxococcales bacterium]